MRILRFNFHCFLVHFSARVEVGARGYTTPPVAVVGLGKSVDFKSYSVLWNPKKATAL
jgi:hypothetical protein